MASKWRLWITIGDIIVSLMIMTVLPFCLFSDCKNGHKWLAHGLFVIYIVLKFIFDLLLYQKFKRDYIDVYKFDFGPMHFLRWLYLECCGLFAQCDLYTDICFFRILMDAHDNNFEDWEVILTLSVLCVVLSFRIVSLFYAIILGITKKTLISRKYHGILVFSEQPAQSFLWRHFCKQKLVFLNTLIFLLCKLFFEDCIQAFSQFYYISSGTCQDSTIKSGKSFQFILVSIGISLFFTVFSICKVIFHCKSEKNIHQQKIQKNEINFLRSDKVTLKEPSLDEIHFLAEYLLRCNNLVSFCFEGPLIEEDDMTPVCASLRDYEGGKKDISLGFTFIEELGKRSVEALSNALAENTWIKQITIRECGMEGCTSQFLKSFLSTKSCIRFLKLKGVNLNGKGEYIQRIILESKTLTTLKIIRANLNQADAGFICVALSTMRGQLLEKINLSENFQNNKLSTRAILRCLVHYSHLRKVSMKSTGITNEVFLNEVVLLLKRNPPFESLSFKNNLISDSGASAILDVLKWLGNIPELKLTLDDENSRQQRELKEFLLPAERLSTENIIFTLNETPTDFECQTFHEFNNDPSVFSLIQEGSNKSILSPFT